MFKDPISWPKSQRLETSKYGSRRLVIYHNGSDEIFIRGGVGQTLRIGFDTRRFFEVTGTRGLIVTPGMVGGKNGFLIKDANFYPKD